MKIPKTWQILAAVGSLVLFPLANAPAAVITWETPGVVAYTTPTQVSTNGTYVDSFSHPDLNSNETVNGVTFNRYNGNNGQVITFVGTSITVDLGTGLGGKNFNQRNAAHASSVNDYADLVARNSFVFSPVGARIQLTGLTAGFSYQIQLWQAPWDGPLGTVYSSSSGFTTGVSNELISTAGVIDNGTRFVPNFVLGSFVADGASQSIYFRPGTVAQPSNTIASVSAGQLRMTAIPEPASFALVGVALMVVLAWRRNVSRRRLA